MEQLIYPKGSITNILDTDLVNAPTARELKMRLAIPKKELPVFFSLHLFQLLMSVSSRLIPQEAGAEQVDIAGIFDTSMFTGRSDGWRYDQMPPDAMMFNAGLEGVNETAGELFGKAFIQLLPQQMDVVLTSIQDGKPAGKTWHNLSAALFFEELLVALTEIYYSHPVARELIGDLSVADAKGWTNISLNELDPHEPKEIK